MNTYFEFLTVFLLLFALLYVLVYLPGVLVVKRWYKQNLVFLSTFGLMFLLEMVNGAGATKSSFLWALLFFFFVYNFYLLLSLKIKGIGKVFNIIIDFVICSLTLFASACIVAWVDDLPIKDIILERFNDGSYSFIPGYLYKMIANSIVITLVVVNFKYIHLYLTTKWEERQKYQITKLEYQKKNVEIQFDALQAKVNPHFLYNSLNSIAGLATIDGEKTRKMALALAQFFRYSMNREQEVMITVEQEAEMIGTFLEIEKIRFGSKLNYQIEIPENIRSCRLPRMLLQPIVENSIKHGMKGNIDSLYIKVSFFASDSRLVISVKDDGTPFPKNIIPGYGIQSVYDKLDLLFPGKYQIELRTKEKEFRIEISTGDSEIPFLC